MVSPRGQFFGPKQFILCINDVCKVKLKFVLFADDTNIFCSEVNLNQLLGEVMKEMSKLKICLDRNRLSLNFNKTKILLFGNCGVNIQEQIQIDGAQIEKVHANKFLGVIINEKISWKPHIKQIQSKF